MKFRGSYFSYILVLLSFYFAMGIFISMLSVYLDGIGKSPAEISLIVSGSAIFAIGIIPLVSYLYDRVRNPHTITMSALMLSAFAGLAFAFFRQTWILFLLNGLAISLILSIAPICEKLCASGKFRYASVRVWGAVGFAIAAQTAGFVYQHLASVALFILFSVAVLFSVIGFWGVKGIDYKKQEKEEDEVNIKGKFKEKKPFWWSRNFMFFLIITFIFAGTTGLNSTYIRATAYENSLTKMIAYNGKIQVKVINYR